MLHRTAQVGLGFIQHCSFFSLRKFRHRTCFSVWFATRRAINGQQIRSPLPSQVLGKEFRQDGTVPRDVPEHLDLLGRVRPDQAPG